jgi:hypothetical protein
MAREEGAGGAPFVGRRGASGPGWVRGRAARFAFLHTNERLGFHVVGLAPSIHPSRSQQLDQLALFLPFHFFSTSVLIRCACMPLGASTPRGSASIYHIAMHVLGMDCLTTLRRS